MRYALWMLLLLMGLAQVAPAIEYTEGEPVRLSVRVSSTKVGPGEAVRITASAGDVDYEMGPNQTIVRRLTEDVTISRDASGGTFQKVSVGNNPVEWRWSTATPGTYMLNFTADDAGRYYDDAPVNSLVEVTVSRAGQTPAPELRISADPQVVRLDREPTTTITAQLLGARNLGGQEVRFFTNGGRLSADRATTNATGAAGVTLRLTANDVGRVTVGATYGATSVTTTIYVQEYSTTPYPNPDPYPPYPNTPGFLVSVAPGSMPADGRSAAEVTVRLVDVRGYGVPGRAITLRATVGRLERGTVVTDLLGMARTRLYASETPGTGWVIAESYGARAYAPVTLTDTPRPQPGETRVYLTIDPTTLLADGAGRARVEALVLDGEGRAVPDARVTFSTTLGTLQQSAVVTDAAGRAGTLLTAPDRPGQATVTARVGQITAAGQVTFQGVSAGGPALDLRRWTGQQTLFVAEGWLQRTVQVEGGQQGGVTKVLERIDGTGKVVKTVDLGRYSLLVRDQYGAMRGYGIESDGRAQVTLLKPDGETLRTVTVALPAGSHLETAAYAEPAGHLLVTLMQPDGTRPEVHFFSPAGQPLKVLRDGLSAMPATALGGDGYLVAALPGGAVQLLDPTGALVSQATREEGTATVAGVAAGGEWYAVNVMRPDQKGRLTLFSRQGTALVTFDLDAQRLLPVSGNQLLAAAPDRAVLLDIPGRRAVWSLPGAFERALVVQDKLVIAGQRDPQTQALLSRILVLKLADGSALAVQPLTDLQQISAVLPPDANGMVGVVTLPYTFRFPLP